MKSLAKIKNTVKALNDLLIAKEEKKKALELEKDNLL